MVKVLHFEVSDEVTVSKGLRVIFLKNGVIIRVLLYAE